MSKIVSEKDILKEESIPSLTTFIYNIQIDKTVFDKDTKIFEVIKNFLDREKITQNDLLNAIAEDNNLLSSSVIEKLINEAYLSYRDLQQLGINNKFIKYLAESEFTPFLNYCGYDKLEKINKHGTEVYFWGIPSSGKSCALGAILSVANNGTVAKRMSKDNDCQGYSYMIQLSRFFEKENSVFTFHKIKPWAFFYEMGFDLEDENGATHPITFIDLAGELFHCMYKSVVREPLSEDEVDVLDTLTKILIDNRTGNRKIHFFVIEYGGEKRKYEGLSQTEYLDAALRYIERTGIFKNDTDIIYILCTKVDKAKAVEEEKLEQIVTEYIDDKYKGFFQGLEKICKNYEINGGKVERIPFTLGQVCFQDYCLFNGATAGNVVKKLLTRSKGFKNGKIQKVKSWFKK